MKRDEALKFVRSLMRPTGALGYLVTRGPQWPPAAECREYKKAVGRVMAHAYSLLMPVFDEHPELVPCSESDANGLWGAGEPLPPETSPAGMVPYLDEAHGVIQNVVNRMLADPSLARHKDFIHDSVRQLEDAILKARQMFMKAE
jgi:hypothetical protein